MCVVWSRAGQLSEPYLKTSLVNNGNLHLMIFRTCDTTTNKNWRKNGATRTLDKFRLKVNYIPLSEGVGMWEICLYLFSCCRDLKYTYCTCFNSRQNDNILWCLVNSLNIRKVYKSSDLKNLF